MEVVFQIISYCTIEKHTLTLSVIYFLFAISLQIPVVDSHLKGEDSKLKIFVCQVHIQLDPVYNWQENENSATSPTLCIQTIPIEETKL